MSDDRTLAGWTVKQVSDRVDASMAKILAEIPKPAEGMDYTQVYLEIAKNTRGVKGKLDKLIELQTEQNKILLDLVRGK